MSQLVSVIVPVYNTEKYLKRCLDSIIEQSYKNLEIFVVDDGSCDNSPEICREYEAKDKRITAIFQKNSGVATARNAALDRASGDYYLFVDSDDWIEKNAIEILVKKVQETGADMVMFGVFINNDLQRKKQLQPLIEPASGREVLGYFLRDDGITSTLWNKFYSRKVFGEIRICHFAKYEDRYMMPEIFERCDKVVSIEDCLYNQYIRPGSLVRSGFSDKDLHFIECETHIKSYIEEKFPEYAQYVSGLEINACAAVMVRLLKDFKYRKHKDLYIKLDKAIREKYESEKKKGTKDVRIHADSRYILSHSIPSAVAHYYLLGLFKEASRIIKQTIKRIIKLWK